MFFKWLNIAVSTMVDVLLWSGAFQFFRRFLLNLWFFNNSSHTTQTPADGLDEPSSPSYDSPRSSTVEHYWTVGFYPYALEYDVDFAMVSPAPLFALVIGIDKYLSNGINLSGAVADADAVNEFLQETLRVPKGQVKNLRNEEVTRLTIEAAIEDLGNNPAIKKDDPILIFCAGHGAEANAPSGWPSTNGRIQMLVPHDFITSGSDDSERGQDLAAKKSDNIVGFPLFLSRMVPNQMHRQTVILDCCHSGSGTRTDDDDPTFAVRGIDLPEAYTVAQDLLHDIEPDARASVVAKGFEKTACKHGQEAGERDGRGVFTSALLSLLREKGVGKLTYKDVITRQDPQCEGVHQTRYLFNSKVASPQGELYPIRASSDTPGQYVLEAGDAHGITKNAEFAVFDDRSMASALGTVVVANTTAFTSSCKFVSVRGDEAPFRLAAPGYALQTRVGEDQDVRLFVGKNERLLGIFNRIADEMQAGERGFRLVESRDDEPDLVVTADGDIVHFEIMDKLCRQHGLTHMPFGVDINDSDALHRILQSSADFYWYLRHSSKGSPLAGSTLECMKLKETGEYTDELLEVLMPDPGGHNLNVGGVIMVGVDEEAIYGFKITNTMSVPLYVSMFYFDVSDLSISTPYFSSALSVLMTTFTGSYYQPGSAKKDVDVSLPPGESLAIGYGASGTVPHMYTLRQGQDIDVGFLMLFFSTEYMDLSGIVQDSPFTESRGGTRAAPESRHLWNAIKMERVPREVSAATVDRVPQSIGSVGTDASGGRYR
ncbi:hypothetical protein EV421DRAFT_1737216 [Armillaria borealis]|uniref:Peptidase C14 caspase domain-containing protein n=1 Tax=Armillaria borealis TaxID=47425 RepID=A0AA39JEK9_9AGAR|nr:hypothetical protein EV421DRAFT_1737216 [Armillaria borealis]